MSNTNLGYTFDATQVAPASRPPALPTGWYNVMITQGEIKPTKSNDGGFVEIGLKVIDGEHAGRMVFDRLNLWNNNPLAVEIAQGTLSAICHATNVFQVQDVSQLFGKPLMARFVYKPAGGGYDEGNDVKGYAKTGEKQTSTNGAALAANVTGVASAPTGAPNFTPPWGAAPQAAPQAGPPPPPIDSPVTPTPPWVPPQQAAPPQAAPPAAGPTPPWAR